MNNLPVVTLKLHRTNKQRLKVFYEGEPVQGLDGNPSIAVRQHYHLLRGEMDDDLIAGVITALAALESVVAVDEFNAAPPWLKHYWVPLLVQ